MSKNKGITLIALIITIIVMLILVAVTINLAVNGGLFGYAGNATKDTELAKEQELSLSDGMVGGKRIEDWVTGVSSLLPNTIIPEGGIYVRMPKTVYYSEITDTEKGNLDEAFRWYSISGKTFDTLEYGGDTVPNGLEAMDIYLYDDYVYVYNLTLEVIGVVHEGWTVNVVCDQSKTNYGELLNSINGEELTSMWCTFSGCTSLTTAPTIPRSVTNLNQTFQDCTSLTTAPVIPNDVTGMYRTFYNCTSLTGTITINANPTKYNDCFIGTTKPIHLTGASTMLNSIAENRSNITY